MQSASRGGCFVLVKNKVRRFSRLYDDDYGSKPPPPSLAHCPRCYVPACRLISHGYRRKSEAIVGLPRPDNLLPGAVPIDQGRPEAVEFAFLSLSSAASMTVNIVAATSLNLDAVDAVTSIFTISFFHVYVKLLSMRVLSMTISAAPAPPRKGSPVSPVMACRWGFLPISSACPTASRTPFNASIEKLDFSNIPAALNFSQSTNCVIVGSRCNFA